MDAQPRLKPEASGTGKGQFYHYFRSNEGLVHEVLQWYLEDIVKGTSPLSTAKQL
jgi:AcrR family transcriptional regulator